MLLSPAGWLYGKIADIRNALYDHGVLRSHDLGARTISIGNITAGGTGKTPLVAYVAEILAGAGEKVCILTRGYGRESSGRMLVSDGEKVLVDARTGGDEPVELARKLIGKAIVAADADRVAAAAWARERFGITVFILDDGFQHRRARRDLDIVCIDASDPAGSGRILPAGKLREPFENIDRATAIVITRSNLALDLEEISVRLRQHNMDAPIFISRNRVAGAVRLGESAGVPEWASLRSCGNGDNEVSVLAFCGLGNPEAFFTDLLRAFEEGLMNDEFDLSIVKKFPDHHRYSQSDIIALERQAREKGIHALLTTAKDAVKLEGLKFQLPCFVAQTDLVMNDQESFRKLIISS